MVMATAADRVARRPDRVVAGQRRAEREVNARPRA